ncbi:MAG: class I SAM-dependent methyltransferase [bacterium]
MSNDYHETRLTDDGRRDVLWHTLWQCYFKSRISPDDCVLDIGAGYGQFINNVIAKRRIALDLWPGMKDHLAEGVEPIIGDLSALSHIEDKSVDFAFASNIFEHVTQDKFAETLEVLRLKLKEQGRLTILQPNYFYAYREYFDDYTHISVWSHTSLADFLKANGYVVEFSHSKFLPLTIKSRLPVSPILIKLYLRSPIRPMGKQMLFVAKPRR